MVTVKGCNMKLLLFISALLLVGCGSESATDNTPHCSINNEYTYESNSGTKRYDFTTNVCNDLSNIVIVTSLASATYALDDGRYEFNTIGNGHPLEYTPFGYDNFTIYYTFVSNPSKTILAKSIDNNEWYIESNESEYTKLAYMLTLKNAENDYSEAIEFATIIN